MLTGTEVQILTAEVQQGSSFSVSSVSCSSGSRVVVETLLWETHSSSTQRHVRVLTTLSVVREDRVARQNGVDVEHELRVIRVIHQVSPSSDVC